MGQDDELNEMTMNPAELYREEVFTDRKVGTIRQLTPVKADGSTDAAREVTFVGQAQLLTPMGALPLSFKIEAKTLAEAITGFAKGAEAAVERTMRELQEMRREAASQIVIPEPGAGGMGGLGGPGGGKIQLR